MILLGVHTLPSSTSCSTSRHLLHHCLLSYLIICCTLCNESNFYGTSLPEKHLVESYDTYYFFPLPIFQFLFILVIIKWVIRILTPAVVSFSASKTFPSHFLQQFPSPFSPLIVHVSTVDLAKMSSALFWNILGTARALSNNGAYVRKNSWILWKIKILLFIHYKFTCSFYQLLAWI